jgi:hypothetical protein
VSVNPIAATYQTVKGTATITIARRLFTLSGVVTDGTSGGVLPNIRIDVSDGENAGKSTLSDGAGTYAIGAWSIPTLTHPSSR